jgi:hypothetical protein
MVVVAVSQIWPWLVAQNLLGLLTCLIMSGTIFRRTAQRYEFGTEFFQETMVAHTLNFPTLFESFLVKVALSGNLSVNLFK